VTVVGREARTRWLVVAAVVAILVGIPIGLANRPMHRPRISLDTLYGRILASAKQPYHGYAVSTGTAAIPTLPDLGSVIALLDGETSYRVWYAGPDRWRVDTLSTEGERDLYRSSIGETLWDSGTEQFITIAGDAPSARLPRGADLIPPTLARRLLSDAAVAGSARTALPARRIAGVTAAGLRVTPDDKATTVGHIDVWADPATGLPLAVEVTTRGATVPVLSTRFLDVSQATPPRSATNVPPTPPGAGSTIVPSIDVLTTLRGIGGVPLPSTLDGNDRVDQPHGTIRGLAAYGNGLRRFVVISLPSSFAFSWYRAAQSAGAVMTRYGGADTATIATPLLSVVIMTGPFGYGIALAGPVQSDVLVGAAKDLTSIFEPTF
jgi:hypothetical protein